MDLFPRGIPGSKVLDFELIPVEEMRPQKIPLQKQNDLQSHEQLQRCDGINEEIDELLIRSILSGSRISLEEVFKDKSREGWVVSLMMFGEVSIREFARIKLSKRAVDRVFKAESVVFNPCVAILCVGMAAGAGAFSLNAKRSQNHPLKYDKYHRYVS